MKILPKSCLRLSRKLFDTAIQYTIYATFLIQHNISSHTSPHAARTMIGDWKIAISSSTTSPMTLLKGVVDCVIVSVLRTTFTLYYYAIIVCNTVTITQYRYAILR